MSSSNSPKQGGISVRVKVGEPITTCVFVIVLVGVLVAEPGGTRSAEVKSMFFFFVQAPKAIINPIIDDNATTTNFFINHIPPDTYFPHYLSIKIHLTPLTNFL
jgi:hypothetical protein